MLRQTLKKCRGTIVFCLLLGLLCSNAFAAQHGGGRNTYHGGRNNYRGGNYSYHGGNYNYHGDRYRYHDGRWYKSDLFWFEAGITALAVGAIVASLPPSHTTVVVEGAPYYYYENTYFRPIPDGYVVVPAPAVVMPAGQDSFIVNVPNVYGDYTSVTLRRYGSGFIGPRGEYYAGFPTIEQLKVLYSR